MPKRMIRDWTDSPKFDGISVEAERLFVRLIMKADDYGRFHAEPRIIRGICFPLLDNLRSEHVGRWLDELHHRNLIFRYEVGAQKLLAIINFGQRLKQSRWKFPAPEGESGTWLPTSGNFRENTGSSPPEEEEEDEEEKKRSAATIPDVLLKIPEFAQEWADFRLHRKKIRKPMTARAEELILKKLAQKPDRALMALRMCQEKCWQSFEWDWPALASKTIHKLSDGKPKRDTSGLSEEEFQKWKQEQYPLSDPHTLETVPQHIFNEFKSSTNQ